MRFFYTTKANKLVSHSYMDSRRRHEILQLKKEDFITHGTAKNMTFMISLVSLSPVPTGTYVVTQVHTAHIIGLYFMFFWFF